VFLLLSKIDYSYHSYQAMTNEDQYLNRTFFKDTDKYKNIKNSTQEIVS